MSAIVVVVWHLAIDASAIEPREVKPGQCRVVTLVVLAQLRVYIGYDLQCLQSLPAVTLEQTP